MRWRRFLRPAVTRTWLGGDWPDLGPVATALGGRGFTVHRRRDFDLALEQAVHAGPPTLIDVRIDPDTVTFSGPDHAPRETE